MSSSVSFEEIVDVKIDNRGKTPPTVVSGHPLIEVNALVNCGLHPNIKKVSKFVDEDVWQTWFRQHLQKDDVIFSTVGTIGETAIVSDNPNYAIAQNILGFRFDKDLVSPLYMLFLMRSNWFMHQVTGRTIETVQKSIKWSDMKGIKLNLPPVDTQEKIAKVLCDLDRKIELNRQMNVTLEQIGQTLFKKYFVDSLESGGWKNSEISEIAEHVKISRKPQEEPDDDFLQYSIPAFDSGLTPEVSVGSKIMSNKYQVIENSILVSKLNPSTPKVWPVFNAEKNAVCSTEFVVLKPKKYYAFIYFLLNSRLYKETMIAAAGGTSNSHKRVSPGFITSFAFPTPPSELLDSFEAAAHNLIYKQQLNISETVTLSKLRDSLLPKLISGEIKV
jgi:type I restriction enzyme S subunit